MIRIFYLLCVVLCWEFAPAPAHAAKVADLYEAEVAVADQGAAARAAGMREALASVLLKVSGRLELPRPGLDQAQARAEQAAVQYRFRAEAPAAPPAQPNQILWVRFDEARVNAMLGEMGMPVWGATRPSVLVWLALEETGRRWLVGGESRAEVAQRLQSQARRRGLPLWLPLLDLQDQARIGAADVWGDFQDVIRTASARYQADAILAGRVMQGASGGWQGRWTLHEGGEAQAWEASAADQDALLAAMTDQLAAFLAGRYARVADPNARAAMVVEVSQVRTLADYARVMQYLRALDNVKDVELLRSEADRLRIRIDVQGETQALVRLMSLGQVLSPAPGEGAAGVDGSYRLAP